MDSTTEMWERIIKFLSLVFGAAGGLVIGWWKYQDRLKSAAANAVELERIKSHERIELAKENSAGATAMSDLLKRHEKIAEDVKEIDEKVDQNNKEAKEGLRELGKDIKEYTLQVISLLRK